VSECPNARAAFAWIMLVFAAEIADRLERGTNELSPSMLA